MIWEIHNILLRMLLLLYFILFHFKKGHKNKCEIFKRGFKETTCDADQVHENPHSISEFSFLVTAHPINGWTRAMGTLPVALDSSLPPVTKVGSFKVIPQKSKLPMIFFEAFPECSLPRTFSKNQKNYRSPCSLKRCDGPILPNLCQYSS